MFFFLHFYHMSMRSHPLLQDNKHIGGQSDTIFVFSTTYHTMGAFEANCATCAFQHCSETMSYFGFVSSDDKKKKFRLKNRSSIL